MKNLWGCRALGFGDEMRLVPKSQAPMSVKSNSQGATGTHSVGVLSKFPVNSHFCSSFPLGAPALPGLRRGRWRQGPHPPESLDPDDVRGHPNHLPGGGVCFKTHSHPSRSQRERTGIQEDRYGLIDNCQMQMKTQWEALPLWLSVLRT